MPTLDDIQKYARAFLQFISGMLVTYGLVKPDASWVQPAIGLGVSVASFLWTVWGSRFAAKLSAVTVDGVTVKVDPAKAPPAAVAAAADPSQPKITFVNK